MFVVGAARCGRVRKRALGKLVPSLKKMLRSEIKSLISSLAQFRTCLWSCVSRWVSGQEAGQPPRKRDPASLSRDAPLEGSLGLATVTGSRRRTGAPRSQRGTRLKATTDRAFLVSTGIPPPARATEKACPSLPGVRRENSRPIHGSTIRSEFKASSRLHRAATPKHSRPRSNLNGSRRWAVWRVL